MMQPLNLSRNFKKCTAEYADILMRSRPSEGAVRGIARAQVAVAALDRSTKFLLPAGGRVLNDRAYKAMDERQPLRLPYPIIALEYVTANPLIEPDNALEYEVDRTIVLAQEVPSYSDLGPSIMINPIIHTGRVGESFKMWQTMPSCAIPMNGYLDRSVVSPTGYHAIMMAREPSDYTNADYGDEVGTLMDFLNALRCSNVGMESIGSAQKKPTAKLKNALAFDTYHVLTINGKSDGEREASGRDGSGTSPREHLRRGHIRVLQTGKAVWVNATVVNAGVGGRIDKDYRMAAMQKLRSKVE